MIRRLAIFFVLLLPVLGFAAAPPTTLRVVDLRWISGQPELETWVGSLQGLLNRQEDETPVFLVRNDTDAAWADSLVRMYGLQKEVLTPGALLAQVKPALTGQVLYTPKQPWTRNIALTAAAVSPGKVIVTDSDLGVPTALDLRDRWTNRQEAYAWAVTEFGEKTDRQEYVLAPESGHLLADLITARKLLAIDLSPVDKTESAALRELLKRLPAEGRLLGYPDARGGDAENAFWMLTDLLRESGQTLVPARYTANLSCFARFPVTRPLLQRQDEYLPRENAGSILVLVYDGGSPLHDGSQSLDHAADTMTRLLDDPAIAGLPVGIETPMTLLDYAPAMYQGLLARQRMTGVELIAAPNGNGWALPMFMPNSAPYLQRSAERARAMGLTGMGLFDLGGQDAYVRTLNTLGAGGWLGTVVRPLAKEYLADGKLREGGLFTGLVAAVAGGRAKSPAELRAQLKTLKGPLHVIYLDPDGVPPAALAALMPEITTSFTPLTPSQAFRVTAEYSPMLNWLAETGARTPKRKPATLQVSTPTTTLTGPTAEKAIPVTVRIEGTKAVLVARLIYAMPDGGIGAADLRRAENGEWKGTVPPTLTGGTLAIRARVVEQDGFGVAISEPLTLDIPVADGDKDGADDTLEAYQGSDPARRDTDGDGLPDGLDGCPTRVDRAITAYFAAINPPADKSVLADAGASTADENGRLIPAGKVITYRLPLKDLPQASSALRLITTGAGTVTVNAGAPAPLDSLPDAEAASDIPLTTAEMSAAELTVKLTAGEKPVRLLSLSLLTNPAGPSVASVQVAPVCPPAGIPVGVQVMAYSPHGVKAVRLRYGTGAKTLQTLPLKLVDGSGGVIFIGETPKLSGPMLVYGVEAEDNNGNITATPYAAMPVGRNKKHTVSLIGTRDLYGDWEPAPIWGATGRALTTGSGEDKHQFLARPGTYAVWLLAQPRERGITVTVEKRGMGKEAKPRLARTIPGGSPDGWYRMGTFKVSDSSTRLYVAITPDGPKGYCAYGTVVLTQDDTFTPPLTHAGLDWYNTVTITGANEGQTVKGKLTLSVLTTGNIDAVDVLAVPAGKRDSDGIHLQKQGDGSYLLDAAKLPAGTCTIKATGYRYVTEGEDPHPFALVTATLHITVAGK